MMLSLMNASLILLLINAPRNCWSFQSKSHRTNRPLSSSLLSLNQQCHPSLFPSSELTKSPRRHLRVSRSSPLFLSNDMGGVSAEGDGPPRKRDVLLSFFKNIVMRIVAIRQYFTKTTEPLLKRIKNSKTSTRIINAGITLYFLTLFASSDMLPTSSTAAPAARAPTEISYSKFLGYCEGKDASVKGPASAVHIDNVNIHSATSNGYVSYRVLRGDSRAQRVEIGRMKSSKNADSAPSNIPHDDAITYLVDGSATTSLLEHMRKHDIDFKAASASSTAPTVAGTASSVAEGAKDNLAFTAAAGYVIYQIYQRGGTGTGASKGEPGEFGGKSKKVTSFDDIEGIDGAKHDVMELVDTLRNPEKYSLVGARAPTGLLLEGPPGTGKTTLARALASMADVPLLHCSGSDFVELYVGQGAARVRKLFAKARKVKGPCIIFIDEIDALAKKRGDGSDGSRDEAEQTLNALLTSMDGLSSDSDENMICVLGATNRKDVLDPAVIRPGRFDRIIKVDLPSEAGRERILRVHASKLHGFKEGYGVDPYRPYSLGRGKFVDLSAVAAETDGLSGADLEQIVNEAAIRAVRRVSAQLKEGVDIEDVDNTVYAQDFETAVDSFFESRDKTQKKKKGQQMGFVLD